MRRININNKSEVEAFKREVTCYMQISDTNILPYRLDDLTNKGGNYTIIVPLEWKDEPICAPAILRGMLRNEVDADKITIEYIDFFKGKTE